MTEDREALYRTICDHPEDDTPRLVYADWLQEHGDDARAEFIRVQCERDAIDMREPRFAELLLREWQLWMCHGPEWRSEVGLGVSTPAWGGRGTVQHPSELPRYTDFQRGFPEWSVIGSGIWFDAVARRTAHLPARGIEIRGVPTRQWMLDLFRSEVLEPITGLVFNGKPHETGADDLEIVTESPTLRNLRRLRLNSRMCREGRVEALAKPGTFPELRSLDLSLSDISNPSAWERLWCSSLAENLRDLVLREIHVDITDRIPSLGPRLRSFEVRGPSLNPTRALSLAAESQELTSLELASNSGPFESLLWPLAEVRPLGRLSLKAELNSSHLPAVLGTSAASTLHTLELAFDAANGQGTQALTTAEHLRSLRCLRLEVDYASQGDLQTLFAGPFPGLISLSWPGTRRSQDMRAAMVEALSALELPKLRHLDLSSWPLSTRGAETLARRSNLSSLRSLVLTGCGIRPKGARALLESPYLQNLEYLDLSHNPLGHGADILADDSVMPNLVRCRLDYLATGRPALRTTRRISH